MADDEGGCQTELQDQRLARNRVSFCATELRARAAARNPVAGDTSQRSTPLPHRQWETTKRGLVEPGAQAMGGELEDVDHNRGRRMRAHYGGSRQRPLSVIGSWTTKGRVCGGGQTSVFRACEWWSSAMASSVLPRRSCSLGPPCQRGRGRPGPWRRGHGRRWCGGVDPTEARPWRGGSGGGRGWDRSGCDGEGAAARCSGQCGSRLAESAMRESRRDGTVQERRGEGGT